ncbi:hypothetical protein [Herbaspirillum sp. C7C8]|uniref:hypothetical protein n=1 Tax=Herbaspirillum sp. C7C8 TaxID=2736665 RepID=UPI001F516B22|nr:hypothetical protein [Herbaspirillum sp. C7C8]MCI1005408.1 hypothetical protein [Herbaspirillum sp. C7C8]
MQIRRTLSLALTTVLAGCATSQPVTQIDKDTYLLVASSRWHGNDGVAVQGLQQADDWCRQQGRHARIIGSERSEGVIGVMPPKIMLSFKCDLSRP